MADEDNLLRIDMQHADINNLVKITEKAYTLMHTLHLNLNRKIKQTEDVWGMMKFSFQREIIEGYAR